MRGEDGLCTAGRPVGAAEPDPGGAARSGQGDAQCSRDELRRRQHPDAGALAVEGLDVHRRRRPRDLPAPGDRPRRVGAHVRAPGRLHRRGRDDPGRRVHRRRPRAPRPDAPLRRGGVREHRRHAGRPLLPRRRCGLRARAGRRVHARPRGRRLPRRPPDRRQPRPARHPRLQLRLLRRVEEGRPQDVEQDRPRPRRPGAPRRVQDHPDAARRPGRADRRPLGHRQDDDHLHAPERVAPGPGRLRRVVARRLGLGDRGRMLRQDVRAQPEGRARPSTARSPARTRTSRT